MFKMAAIMFRRYKLFNNKINQLKTNTPHQPSSSRAAKQEPSTGTEPSRALPYTKDKMAKAIKTSIIILVFFISMYNVLNILELFHFF